MKKVCKFFTFISHIDDKCSEIQYPLILFQDKLWDTINKECPFVVLRLLKKTSVHTDLDNVRKTEKSSLADEIIQISRNITGM